jgi:hypothetical protein
MYKKPDILTGKWRVSGDFAVMPAGFDWEGLQTGSGSSLFF